MATIEALEAEAEALEDEVEALKLAGRIFTAQAKLLRAKSAGQTHRCSQLPRCVCAHWLPAVLGLMPGALQLLVACTVVSLVVGSTQGQSIAPRLCQYLA